MANFLVNSAGLVTTGTDNAETFLIQSGAVSATTVIGNAGNDTIELLEGTGSADAVSIAGGGGADVYKVSGTTFDTASVLRGGAGGDTITFSGAVNFEGSVFGGDGSDVLEVKNASEFSDARFGAGADKLSSNVVVSASGATIAMGAGKDTLQLNKAGQLASATIFGGGGADTITISATTDDSDGVKVDLGAGSDTLKLDLAGGDKVQVVGGTGNDYVIQSAGELDDSASILLGAGNDSLSISKVSASASSANAVFDGGTGNDTLVFTQSGIAGVDASVMGGAGADSINIAGTLSGVDTVGGTVMGGAGADSITFSGTINADSALATYIGITNLSDSTETEMDVVTFTMSGASDSGANISFEAMGLGLTLQAGTDLAIAGASATDGIVVFSGSAASSLSERLSKVDTLLATEGQFAVFEDVDGSAGYLFIQGGSTDTVVKLNESTGGLSGFSAAAVVSNSSIRVDFLGG